MKKFVKILFWGAVYLFQTHSASAQVPLVSPYLDSVIMAKMETAHLAGVSACIIKNDEISWIGNYGFANIEQGTPVDTTTLFYMASVSKTVTGTALLQLWENSLFELDDDINDYLPFEVHNPNYPALPITFRMLCTHTSCIKDNSAVNPYYWGEDSPIPLGQFLFDYLDPQGANYFPNLNFYNQAPGTAYNYSNVGTALAGYLVEVLGDSTFAWQTAERIFDPLQMNETAWFLSEVDTTNLAMPYYWNGSELVPYGFYTLSTYPAGALRTSVDQLAKFLLAYMNGGSYMGEQILQSSTIDSIMTLQIPSIDPTQGLFWYKLYLGGRWLWGHEGTNLGAMTYMGFYPDENTGVIVFSNTADYIGYQIIDLLFDYASDSIPCSCLPEGITFTTQAQIDSFQVNYPGCSEIEGYVKLSGSPYEPDTIKNLNGLSVLTSIGGNLEIEFCESLNGLQGLQNLEFIGGGFYLNWNAFSNLEGLQNLGIIAGDFIIGGGENLNNLTGLDNLQTIGGSVSFGYGTMGGPACTHLVSLTGLENLNSIGGDLSFYCNILLQDLSELSGLLYIEGELWIYDNPELQSLAGLENIETGSISNLSINSNYQLSTCEVQSICDYLAMPGAQVSIYDNAPGCNSPEEVQEACLTSIEDISEDVEFNISPNPVTGYAEINLNSTSSLPVEISLYNTTGICVKSWQYPQIQTGKNIFILDLKEIPAGLYFCRVQIGNEMVTKKIIKL